MKPSWEVKLDAYLASTSETVDPYVAPVESNALTKLQETLSFSTLQTHKTKSLNSIWECLNNLAADGLVSNESVLHLTTILELTQLYFDIFEKALQANEELIVATAAQEAILPKLEAIKAKKEKMEDLDRQITGLQSQRSVIAYELKKDFEVNKPRLAECMTDTKQVQVLKAAKMTRQTDITIRKVKWLELKATLQAFLPSTP